MLVAREVLRRLAELRIDDHRVALLKPETYMNDSGSAVGAARRFYKLEPDACSSSTTRSTSRSGRLQARMGGGLAGHNGLRSVASAPEDAGVHAPAGRRGEARPGRPASGGGLRAVRFEPADDAEALVSRAADAVESLDAEGLEPTQAKFN